MSRRKPPRDGQLWWQDGAPNIPGRGRWVIVIGRGKNNNPTVHTVLASRGGSVFLADIGEHSLRPWEEDDTFRRVQ